MFIYFPGRHNRQTCLSMNIIWDMLERHLTASFDLPVIHLPQYLQKVWNIVTGEDIRHLYDQRLKNLYTKQDMSDSNMKYDYC